MPRDIVLSHDSALEYWANPSNRTAANRKNPLLLPPKRDASRKTRLSSQKVSEGDTQALRYAFREMHGPLDVLVASASLRTQLDGMRAHVWSVPLPGSSLVRVGDGMYVCTPEFCFVQLAQTHTRFELAERAFELAGTYARAPSDFRRDEQGTTYGLAPLTTTERLTRFAEGLPKVRGKDKALDALRFVANGSASPMETKLVMAGSMSRRIGGAGLPTPLLNHTLKATEAAQKASGMRAFRCDLYWPEQKVCVEYDSDAFHADPKVRAKNELRRNGLEIMGIRTISVTWDQFRSPADLQRVLHAVGKALGVRMREKTPAEQQSWTRLLRYLYGWDS